MVRFKSSKDPKYCEYSMRLVEYLHKINLKLLSYHDTWKIQSSTINFHDLFSLNSFSNKTGSLLVD